MQTTVADGYGGYGIIDKIRPRVTHEPVRAADLLATATHHEVNRLEATWKSSRCPFAAGKTGVWAVRCRGVNSKAADQCITDLRDGVRRELAQAAIKTRWESEQLRPSGPSGIAPWPRRMLSNPWFVGVCTGLIVAGIVAAIAVLWPGT